MKKLLIKLVRWYQMGISPNRPNTCKYKPSCSNYALNALRSRNTFIAVNLSIWRYLRCNKFSKGGFDPVPEPRATRYKYISLEETLNKLH